MKLLITGSTGFIGRHLCRALLNNGIDFIALVRSATDTTALRQSGTKHHIEDTGSRALIEWMTQECFDGVIHLASCFLVQHEPEDIDRLIESNLAFPTRILEATARSKIKWFLNTGTFWQNYQNHDYDPVNLYAATKEALLDIARYYTETTSLIITTIKINDTYGPDDTRLKLFYLWNRISQTGELLEMSPGEQLIDIVYIGDVIGAYLQMIENLSGVDPKIHNGKCYAISSNYLVTLQELASLYTKVTGRFLNIAWGGRSYRPREIMTPWSNFEIVPGWKPRYSLEEGIKETLK